jgi:hypothetical protein
MRAPTKNRAGATGVCSSTHRRSAVLRADTERSALAHHSGALGSRCRTSITLVLRTCP